MELIRARLTDKPRINRQKMVAISNSGFPESSHNDLSLSISRRFAVECGFEWAGGFALGGGESIGGQPLEKAGRRVRNVRKSLELAADALGQWRASARKCCCTHGDATRSEMAIPSNWKYRVALEG